MNAGWFPDPSGQPGQRYFDGQRWTQHFVPTPPSMPPPSVAVAVSSGGGPNHALHLVLTVLTCGLWLPIWILVAIFGQSGSSAVVAGGASASAGGWAQSNHRPLILLAVFFGLIVLGAAAEHPWILVLLILIAGAAGALWWSRKSARDREQEERREQCRRDLVANRATYEDQLWHQGDPRGMYGQFMPPPSIQDGINVEPRTRYGSS